MTGEIFARHVEMSRELPSLRLFQHDQADTASGILRCLAIHWYSVLAQSFSVLHRRWCTRPVV